MIKVPVKPSQTLMDLVIQYCGDATLLIEIARLNGLGITDDIIPGHEVIIPAVTNERVANYFKTNKLYPAVVEQRPGQGIGYWGIEENFVVS